MTTQKTTQSYTVRMALREQSKTATFAPCVEVIADFRQCDIRLLLMKVTFNKQHIVITNSRGVSPRLA